MSTKFTIIIRFLNCLNLQYCCTLKPPQVIAENPKESSVMILRASCLILTLSAFPPVLDNFGVNRWSVLRPFTGAITPQEEKEEEEVAKS